MYTICSSIVTVLDNVSRRDARFRCSSRVSRLDMHRSVISISFPPCYIVSFSLNGLVRMHLPHLAQCHFIIILILTIVTIHHSFTFLLHAEIASFVILFHHRRLILISSYQPRCLREHLRLFGFRFSPFRFYVRQLC